MFVPQAVLSTKVPPVLYGSILSKFIEACGNLKGSKRINISSCAVYWIQRVKRGTIDIAT